ncbi:Replicative DNA helicase [Tritonibacter multivorans]|uniref:Replicative DNA helicase n=1 Tax=Tritonibacter multivorans TaxID=928856 RepID=A0A0P1GFG2_9RHOB|nr:replicative DNA helicase [Tritonibacter multivorans]MDA7420934.1 replicative DNA helicase [Tritonibacter multivorans]CUH80498.1 Replicative DNA helicase [Tritonibacter multivorans]SFC81394.1 replicative DNA helicase [Tritonibacter multivorans]
MNEITHLNGDPQPPLSNDPSQGHMPTTAGLADGHMAAPEAQNQELQASELPHSVEAEQQLLGAILTNNDVYDKVASIIDANHFYDPVHTRIYEVAKARISKNALASPVTLKAFMEDDAGLKELGGAAYLVKLASASISAFAVRDYAQMIYDLAIRRELIALGKTIADEARRVDVSSEPKEQIVKAEQALYSLAEQGQTEQGFKSFLRAVTEAVNVTNEAYQRGGGMAGISTGLDDLDKQLGGLHPSDLLILAGRPSMGKTSLATNVAFNVAKAYKKGLKPDGTEGAVDGGVVGFFSLEMSAEQLAGRILAEASEVSSHKIRQGDMTEEEFRRFVQAAKDLEACPLFIDDTPAIPISQLAARARRLKRTHGLDLLVIDYLQLCRGMSDNRVQEIGEISMGMKAIAKELNIPVVALSQLSRGVESRDDKRPQLSDLRESGSIEQDADVVMFVFREEYYKEREKPGDHELDKMEEWKEAMERLHGKAEVIVGKQRHGPIGTVELSFESQFTRFGNLAKPWQQQPDGY